MISNSTHRIKSIIRIYFASALWYVLSFSMVFLNGCSPDEIAPIQDPDWILQGGEGTVFSAGPDAFTFPLPTLDPAGIQRHFLADAAFEQTFVSAPAPLFGGLGPIFNQNACDRCHVRNGRGTIPQFDNDPNTGLLLKMSIPNAGNLRPLPVPGFGNQLQTKSIVGSQPEGVVSIKYLLEWLTYPDGHHTVLRKPVFKILNPYIPLPNDLMISPRNAPPVHGLGLLEAIPEVDLLANEDIMDQDGDGVSGKANRVLDVLRNEWLIGRFGWKAESPTSAQQAAAAAVNDMGLTNAYFPKESCEGQINCQPGLQTGLDVDQETLDLFAFYFQTLAVPARRNVQSAEVRQGKRLFEQVKCSSCHRTTFVTGPHMLDALANQTIHPYTDLLLHDMGEGLADHRPAGDANGNEWRTPPLWGIGLTQIINPNASFLHDGRARNLEEAILWHGGEASGARDHFKSLSAKERKALLAFLNSL